MQRRAKRGGTLNVPPPSPEDHNEGNAIYVTSAHVAQIRKSSPGGAEARKCPETPIWCSLGHSPGGAARIRKSSPGGAEARK